MNGENAEETAWDAIAVDASDDVAVALRDLAPGSGVRLSRGGATHEFTVTEAIPLGHKFALRPLAAGEVVRKYGEVIGTATAAIAPGRHVHVHNLASRRARSAT